MKHIDKKPMVLGIIGGSGTGKTYFANHLTKQLKAHFIEGDAVGHHALLKPEVIQAIKARFGSRVIKEEGIVDRKALGSRVFGNMDALKDLNTIMHPRMYRMIEEEIRAAKEAYIVLEAAVMIEAGFDRLVDVMFCITADEDIRLMRLVKNRGIDTERAGNMIRSGRSDFQDYGDYIIDTSLGLEVILDEVDRIIEDVKRDRYIGGKE